MSHNPFDPPDDAQRPNLSADGIALFILLQLVVWMTGFSSARSTGVVGGNHYAIGIIPSIVFGLHEDSLPRDGSLYYLGARFSVYPWRFAAFSGFLTVVSFIAARFSLGRSQLRLFDSVKLILTSTAWLSWGYFAWKYDCRGALPRAVSGTILFLLIGVLACIGNRSRGWFDRIIPGLWFASTLLFAQCVISICADSHFEPLLERLLVFTLCFVFAWATVTAVGYFSALRAARTSEDPW